MRCLNSYIRDISLFINSGRCTKWINAGPHRLTWTRVPGFEQTRRSATLDWIHSLTERSNNDEKHATRPVSNRGQLDLLSCSLVWDAFTDGLKRFHWIALRWEKAERHNVFFLFLAPFWNTKDKPDGFVWRGYFHLGCINHSSSQCDIYVSEGLIIIMKHDAVKIDTGMFVWDYHTIFLMPGESE